MINHSNANHMGFYTVQFPASCFCIMCKMNTCKGKHVSAPACQSVGINSIPAEVIPSFIILYLVITKKYDF